MHSPTPSFVDIDRVLTTAHQLELAQHALRHEFPPGSTVGDLVAAYTYVVGRLLLNVHRGHVPAAAAEAATVGQQLIRVIEDVLAPVYPHQEPH